MNKDKMNECMKMLEKGVRDVMEGDAYKQYLTFSSRFHQYSYNNCMLIWTQCPKATYVAGFNKWKQLGRNVKKNEKGIRILIPMFRKNEDDEQEVSGYRIGYVFDISQTEGEELAELTSELKGKVEGYADLYDRISSFTDASVHMESDIGERHGYYDVSTHEIVVKTGMSEMQTIKTLIHEVMHSILHGKDALKVDAHTREIQAESAAYVVCQHLGIDSGEYSFGYIASWAADKSDAELNQIMSGIQDISNRMICSIVKNG